MNEEMAEWLKSDDSKEYFELVKIPSVSADPNHLRDSVQCATWLKKRLQRIGAEAELLLPPKLGQGAAGELPVPVLFAELKGGEGAPTILVYGHYDVQPAEPLAAWKTPPFEPTVVGDRVYGRGTQDDKGQSYAFLLGLLSQRRGAGTGPTIKIVYDGQEESGSTNLITLLEDAAFRKRLSADVMVVCDTSAAAELRPAIVAGLRGVSHFTVKLSAANRDLHSGEYGGIAPNAARGLCELLATLHNPDGAIAVAGFRDGIEQPSHEELRLAEVAMPSELDYEKDIGCEPCGGQLGRTLAQRNCFEPTIEVNGMWSGHTGAGAKTIIPCEAYAKLSMRLVPGQSPRGAFAAVRQHLLDRCPKAMRVELLDFNPGTPGFRLPLASPVFRLAEELLKEMDERGPVFVWDGASIPVVSLLREASGAAPLLVGWGQTEDRIHSPNESYSLRQFRLAKAWGAKVAEGFGG